MVRGVGRRMDAYRSSSRAAGETGGHVVPTLG